MRLLIAERPRSSADACAMNRKADLLFVSSKNKSPVGVVWDVVITWNTLHTVSAAGEDTMKVRKSPA